MLGEIERIMDEEVRPQLARHYGDVSIIGLNDGILRIRLMGNCKGCPSARFTIEDVILSALKRHQFEVVDVELVNETSEELLDMARKILARNDR
jgi:Fe-S cluster biogenesis protein NfuA